MKDLMNYVNVRQALAPQIQTNASGALVGAIIDRLGFESLTFAIVLGALTDANATATVLVEHGDAANLSDAAAVPDEQLVGLEATAAFDFADDNECRKIGYSGGKQFVRLTVTTAGNDAGSIPIAAVAILGHPNQVPTVNPPV